MLSYNWKVNYKYVEYIEEFKNDEGKTLNTFLNYMFLLL